MADEKVNLVIGLTDELSAPLKDLGRQVEEFRTRQRDAHDAQIGNLRVLLREVEQVNRNLGQSQQQVQAFGTAFRTALSNAGPAIRGLQSAVGPMGNAMASLGRVAATTVRSLGALGAAGGAAGFAAAGAGAVLAVPGVIGAAAALAYAVGKRVADAAQQERNFRMRMGGETDGQIRRQRAVLESLGVAGGQADQMLTQMSDLVFDSMRGTQSNLSQALEKFGVGGIQIAERVRKVVHEQGQGTKAGIDTLIREVSKQAPMVQRYMWQALNFPAEIMMQHEKAQAALPDLYERSAERTARMEKETQRMLELTTNIGVAFGNLFRRIRDWFNEYLYPILGGALETILQKMPLNYWTRDMLEKERTRELTDTEKRIVDPKAREEFLREVEQELRRRGLKDMEEERRGQGGMTGASPIALRDLSTKESEGNKTLVEIRDVLAWIRTQQGMGADGSQGGGGNGVQTASYGGSMPNYGAPRGGGTTPTYGATPGGNAPGARSTDDGTTKSASRGTSATNPQGDTDSEPQGPAGAVEPGAVTAVGGGAPAAFIMHHTSGRGTAEGVQATLRQRGLGVQYVMERDGTIRQIGGPGSSHMKTGWGPYGKGLSNRNTVGMEVIAKDDNDITPAQIESAKRFMRKYYPNTPLYGHGQVNPGHKEAREGMTIVDAIKKERRESKQKQAEPHQATPPAAKQAPPQEPSPPAKQAPPAGQMDVDAGSATRMAGQGSIRITPASLAPKSDGDDKQPPGGIEVASATRAGRDQPIVINPGDDDAAPQAKLAVNVRGPRGIVSAKASAEGAFESGFKFRQESTMADEEAA